MGIIEVFFQILTWKWGIPTHTTNLIANCLDMKGSFFFTSSKGKNKCRYEKHRLKNKYCIKGSTISSLPVDCQLKQTEILSQGRKHTYEPVLALRNCNYFVISVFSVFKIFDVLLADSAQPP